MARPDLIRNAGEDPQTPSSRAFRTTSDNYTRACWPLLPTTARRGSKRGRRGADNGAGGGIAASAGCLVPNATVLNDV